MASPVSDTDSILLPTAADIGFKIKVFNGKPLSVEEREKLKLAIQGQYSATIKTGEAELTIDDKSIKCAIRENPVQYSYEVIGGIGDTLVVKLTDIAQGKTERATMELDDTLQIETVGNAGLDYLWHKVK